MKEAEAKQLEFIKTHPNILKSKVDIESAAALETEYRKQNIAIADLTEKIARLDKAIAMGEGRYQIPLISAGAGTTGTERDNLRLRTVEEPLLASEMKLAALKQYYGPGHPEVKSLELTLELMRKKLEKIAPLGDEELAKHDPQPG